MSQERLPPLTNEEKSNPLLDDDDEDLFAEANQSLTIQSKETNKSNGEVTDLFGDDETSEISLDTPASGDALQPPSPATLQTPSQQAESSETAKPDLGFKDSNDKDATTESSEPVENGEELDSFTIEINVTDPKKMGEGMNAYMAYKVITKTTIPQFKKTEMGVYRRFSDFLGLHEKLNDRHLPLGRIIPPPPEKSVVGMTKIKMSKEEAGSQDFVEKRRASLERYLNRIGRHPQLKLDSDFRAFLENEGELPKSSSTSALSGAGVIRLFKNVGDSIGKIAHKVDETDPWFEERQVKLETLDQHLRKLHASIESLVSHRKELAMNTSQFARSCSLLANVEEHTTLSRALSQLSEVSEKMDQLHQDAADSDYFVFAALIHDYIMLVAAIKNAFDERLRIFKSWMDAEATLTKKKEARTKLEQARKIDKIPAVSQEITQYEMRVEKDQKDFENISRNIKKEIERFDRQRSRDFRSSIINYLEALMNAQQQAIKHWETFIPEAKAIA